MSDTLDGTGVKSFGWYGCSIYGPVHQDEHGGEIDPCVSRDYGSGRVPNSTESNRRILIHGRQSIAIPGFALTKQIRLANSIPKIISPSLYS
ncbi:MAG: hypothetical protein IPO25_09180 [Saprospiraceae bacterium]|nr:hypothetical protein [Saprospiraceae bacterium]